MKPPTLLCLALLLAGPVAAQTTAADRGALLYETHCIACHGTQMHWRDAKAARDWNGLKAQVRRWQAQVGLGWNDGDIDAVAAHLNQRYYRFARPAGPA